ncbi:hypothetical protein CkaCkLH20_08219 [Colletotrichum karsti]|uniref:2-oxoadipate dioxygenase/decarboxylase n=1 Tax=Colletotrichum karsti TaxID=1095194 RepID=A0A9P6I587_9PEZI|nr:uncharacterized protein CkaCkLH20_08219 [Colletotrichum karsti]KAF9874236.1 hypothetical protein CkaCkLH20_08219 [Colletotrichum karsti]
MVTVNDFVTPDDIRAMFASALSEMYRSEVPQYGTLLELVSDVNRRCNQELSQDSQHRVEVERHGAIRLGTTGELHTMRRLFAIMGMHPVGYYDLTVAGLPVHATCFRPLTREALARNPFRVFTSLLRLDLIDDVDLRSRADEILSRRDIFTPRCVELINDLESCPSVPRYKATEFLLEAVEIFRWHKTSMVDMETYQKLREAHPLIADVVCFKGPHINHLTPRVLDIEAGQVEMQKRGLKAKTGIEGPPPRKFPILLRQTSFLALEEEVAFSDGAEKGGKHRARFGEIEQRGMALTPAGRSLYDQLISQRLQHVGRGASKQEALANIFEDFPDNLESLRKRRLAYFTYKIASSNTEVENIGDVDTLVKAGILSYEPITYEDFLPVSAAGIFHSNLGASFLQTQRASEDKKAFERGLGCTVKDSFDLYREMEECSITKCLELLKESSELRNRTECESDRTDLGFEK